MFTTKNFTGAIAAATELVDSVEKTFYGVGLNDLTVAGTYSGTGKTVFRVVIDGEGTPDTFKWSDDDGVTWTAETEAITGSAQTLSNGVTITFGATTGHTTGEYWRFTVGGQLTVKQIFVAVADVQTDKVLTFYETGGNPFFVVSLGTIGTYEFAPKTPYPLTAALDLEYEADSTTAAVNVTVVADTDLL